MVVKKRKETGDHMCTTKYRTGLASEGRTKYNTGLASGKKSEKTKERMHKLSRKSRLAMGELVLFLPFPPFHPLLNTNFLTRTICFTFNLYICCEFSAVKVGWGQNDCQTRITKI